MLDKKKSGPAGDGNTDKALTNVNSTDNIAESESKSKGNGNKNRYWVGVLYPENMRPDWQDEIGDLVQLPYSYCIHNADQDSQSQHRKDHVHLILVFSNTTTYKHALEVYQKLSADGKRACNTVEPVVNIRHMYEYLIHNTENCRKKGKELYPAEARISGNNFDIGAFEQIGVAEKRAMCRELCQALMEHGFTNFADFYMFVMTEFDDSYFELLQTYSGLFERLTKGNFQMLTEGVRRLQHKVDTSTGEVIE